MLFDLDAAELVREARARSGLSQRALARRAGTSQSVVARLELGETSPTLTTLNRLLAAAGVRPLVELRARASGRRRPASTRDIRDVRDRIQEFFETEASGGIASVYLFGSAARGALHEESDVDVAVLVDRAVFPSSEARSELRVRLTADLIAGRAARRAPQAPRPLLIHEYVGLDYDLVIRALDRLEPIEKFIRTVRDRIEESG